ncbi:guanine nucleotide exchange protein smcr8b [Stigmatopora nigra]
MISSPELLPFTGPQCFGDEAEGDRGGSPARGLLPEELSVPPLSSSAGRHPWSSTAGFQKDFVLVAEFSEQVGPSPVMTIPDPVEGLGSLDLNHFSVRIMSVDYQASGPTPSSYSIGPRLNFNEDSEVVLGDSGDSAFAYVRHMTLLDLTARGMVRPFCMAYVCSQQTKIMDNFDRLSDGFGRAADSLKTGNRQAFSLELHHKLHQLEYERLSLLKDGGENGEDLEAVERAIATHKDLLRQVTSYPNRKRKQPDFLPYEPTDVPLDLTTGPPPPPPTILHRGLKPLHELSNAYFLSLMTDQLAQTEICLRGDITSLRSASITRSLNRKLRLTNFLFEQPEADEVEEDGEDVLLKETGSQSCEQAGEVASSEMTGSISSEDSIQVIGTERSYKTLAAPDLSLSSHTPTLSDSSLTSSTLTTPISAPEATDGTPTGISLKTQEIPLSAPSISTHENVPNNTLSAPTVPIFNHFSNSETPSIAHPSIHIKPTTPPIIPLNSSLELTNPDANELTSHISEPPIEQDLTPDTTLTSLDPVPRHIRVHTRRANSNDSIEVLSTTESIIPEDLTAITEEDESSIDDKPDDRVRKAQDCRATYQTLPRLLSGQWSSVPSLVEVLDGAVEMPSPHRRGCPVVGLSPDETGLQTRCFVKQNSFSRHAVFCLLSGRPLVLISVDEAELKNGVEALTPFLPASCGAVMPCLKTPLQLNDLLTWRLIGIHRSPSSDPLHCLRRYSRYLGVLDLDQKTLRCPAYSGSLVGSMVGSAVPAATFLTHVKCGLTALAKRALLFTFTRQGNQDDGVDKGDLSVMNYLSDLIKRQHIGSGPPVMRFSYVTLHLHKNTANT